MDFLKTLLIYMTLTFAMTVQEAPAPGMAPEVTAVPDYKQAQSIGTATPVPDYTAVPTVTATPKPADPTRSAPTLTPNARYKTLQYGDRGNDVTKLQRRLIELGYMKKGADDGSYGYQTLNAVRDFQKANGLSVDGAAGRVTLTCLYEDPNVVSKTPAATATPVAPVKPEATQAPASATVQTISQLMTAAPNTEAAAETAAPDAAAPEATAATAPSAASITASWHAIDNATVLLNGNVLVLLQRTNDVISQRKPALWMNNGTLMLSLDDLTSAAGSWYIQQSSIDHAQLLLAGYQISLTAVADTSSGTCSAYAATVNGAPCAMNDGDVICSRGKWYVTPAFLTQTTKASCTWDADEQTLVLLVQDASIAGSVD